MQALSMGLVAGLALGGPGNKTKLGIGVISPLLQGPSGPRFPISFQRNGTDHVSQ